MVAFLPRRRRSAPPSPPQAPPAQSVVPPALSDPQDPMSTANLWGGELRTDSPELRTDSPVRPPKVSPNTGHRRIIDGECLLPQGDWTTYLTRPVSQNQTIQRLRATRATWPQGTGLTEKEVRAISNLAVFDSQKSWLDTQLGTVPELRCTKSSSARSLPLFRSRGAPLCDDSNNEAVNGRSPSVQGLRSSEAARQQRPVSPAEAPVLRELADARAQLDNAQRDVRRLMDEARHAKMERDTAVQNARTHAAVAKRDAAQHAKQVHEASLAVREAREAAMTAATEAREAAARQATSQASELQHLRERLEQLNDGIGAWRTDVASTAANEAASLRRAYDAAEERRQAEAAEARALMLRLVEVGEAAQRAAEEAAAEAASATAAAARAAAASNPLSNAATAALSTVAFAAAALRKAATSVVTAALHAAACVASPVTGKIRGGRVAILTAVAAWAGCAVDALARVRPLTNGSSSTDGDVPPPPPPRRRNSNVQHARPSAPSMNVSLLSEIAAAQGSPLKSKASPARPSQLHRRSNTAPSQLQTSSSPASQSARGPLGAALAAELATAIHSRRSSLEARVTDDEDDDEWAEASPPARRTNQPPATPMEGSPTSVTDPLTPPRRGWARNVQPASQKELHRAGKMAGRSEVPKVEQTPSTEHAFTEDEVTGKATALLPALPRPSVRGPSNRRRPSRRLLLAAEEGDASLPPRSVVTITLVTTLVVLVLLACGWEPLELMRGVRDDPPNADAAATHRIPAIAILPAAQEQLWQRFSLGAKGAAAMRAVMDARLHAIPAGIRALDSSGRVLGSGVRALDSRVRALDSKLGPYMHALDSKLDSGKRAMSSCARRAQLHAAKTWDWAWDRG